MVYAVVGSAGLVLALVSRSIRQWPISEPLVALMLGVLLGPALLGVISLSNETRDLVLLEGSRLLLCWSVMAAALRFPARSLRPVVRAVVLLLVVAMPLAALVTGAAALLLGVPVVLAAVIGACLCPTDPVLAASVVTGEPAEQEIPGRLRRMLSVESGANDGLAFPLVAAAIAVALPQEHIGSAIGGIAWEVLGATLIGAVVGAAAGWGVRAATQRRDLESGPELALTLLLAVAVLGLCRVANTDGVLGAFVAGLAYNALVKRSEREPEDGIDEAINRYAVLPLFLLLGVSLPWREWWAFGPGALGFVAALLLLRRLPFVLMLARPLGLRSRDALFAGWFGPIGVSAVFYLAHSADQGVGDPRIFAAGTLAVTVSVVAFGVTSSPFRKLYAR